MHTRAFLVFAFALGCTSSSSTPDMPAAPSQDLAMMTTHAADMAMMMGPADMAKGKSPSTDMAVQDMAKVTPTLYTLTVNNTLAWCDVIVTINGHATEFKTQGSMTFMAADTTTVMLSATPNPGFFAVKWTGVSTMSGSMATYVMTTGANQSVTACCPTDSMGGGC